MPLAGDGAFALVEAPQQQRREVDNPAMNCGMVDTNAALGQHFFQIAQAEIVSQVPANAQHDHRAVEMTA